MFSNMIKEEILKDIKPGARIKVWEGQAAAPFEGMVIARKHGAQKGATFTVRTTLAGVGVEKIFPLYSPNITKAEIVSSPKNVHRSKLYFVRKMAGRAIRKKLGVSA
jgi:large subunit ribosomal protein L19